MSHRKSFLLLVCLIMAVAGPALHALTVRNGTTLTVEAVFDDVLAPAIEAKTLRANEQWNIPTSAEARYQLSFREGDRMLASTVLHGGARVAGLEATPAGYRIVVGASESAAAADDRTPASCLRGQMIGLVLGCLTFNADNGQSYTVTGNTSGLPVIGPACLCGVETGPVGPCLGSGFFVETQCLTGAAAEAQLRQSLIVRNLTPTPVRVNIMNPPALVIESRDIPSLGSITLPGGPLMTSLVFFVDNQRVASSFFRNVAVAVLEKLPTRYAVAIIPDETPGDAATRADAPIRCWSGRTIGLVMDSLAFTSEGQTYYLAGNLRGVPMLGQTCLCGRLLPPNEKAPIPLPIIDATAFCGE
jgi:hypothetical protein